MPVCNSCPHFTLRACLTPTVWLAFSHCPTSSSSCWAQPLRGMWASRHGAGLRAHAGACGGCSFPSPIWAYTCVTTQRLKVGSNSKEQMPGWITQSKLVSVVGIWVCTFSGVAWMLRRVQAAPWLRLSMPNISEDWRFSAPGSHARLTNILQEHCQAAAAASRELKHLRFLVR